MRKLKAFLFAMMFVIATVFYPTKAVPQAGTSSENQQPTVTEGKLLQRVAPVYPPIAKAARIQGTVVLQAVIGKDGFLNSITVVSGPPLLQQAAVDAVKQWKYQPYLLNGEPVEVKTTLNIAFTLGIGEEAPSQQNQAAAQSAAEPAGSQPNSSQMPSVAAKQFASRQQASSPPPTGTIGVAAKSLQVKTKTLVISPAGEKAELTENDSPDFCGSGGCALSLTVRIGSGTQKSIWNGLGALQSVSVVREVHNGYYTLREMDKWNKEHSDYVWNGHEYEIQQSLNAANTKHTESANDRQVITGNPYGRIPNITTCNNPEVRPTVHVGVFLLGESVCDALKKAGIPVSKLPEIEENKFGLTLPSTSDLEEMVEKLFKGSHEAYNLVFNGFPPNATLKQVWVITRSPFATERSRLVAKYGIPTQEQSKWSGDFDTRYREAIWVLPDNTTIDLVEDGVQNAEHGFMRFTQILYLEKD